MFRQTMFPQFSNMRGGNPGGYRDIESIHNDIHTATGGIMADLDVASFSPLFWLHHCNIDRLFETYLDLEPNSSSEMHRSEFNQSAQPWGARISATFRMIGYRYDRLAEDDIPRDL